MSTRVTVVGTGYLGVTHAVCLAEAGHEVRGLDVDREKIQALAAGSLPIHEPDLAELLRRHVSSGRLRFTSSFEEVGTFGDVHFLCVGTPQQRNGPQADLSHLDAAVDALAPHLRRQCFVVGKSTVPVGTSTRVAQRLAMLAPAGRDVEVAWNPEFLREGHAVADSLEPERIVIGVASDLAEKVLREVYAMQLDAGVPLIVTDVATAELVKMASNAFLATKISFMNAMAEVCDAAGTDVMALRDALGSDERIGRRYLHAGIGFGGGCLPKDIRALMAWADDVGAGHAATLLREVDEINVSRRSHMVALAQQACGGSVLGRRIGVLGAAFKPRSDDIRDSPALNVSAQLQLHGASVSVYDPAAARNVQREFPGLHCADTLLEAADGADLLMHLTEWEEFQDLDPRVLDGVVARKYLLDGRNALDAARWRRAGWTYRGIGRQ